MILPLTSVVKIIELFVVTTELFELPYVLFAIRFGKSTRAAVFCTAIIRPAGSTVIIGIETLLPKVIFPLLLVAIATPVLVKFADENRPVT